MGARGDAGAGRRCTTAPKTPLRPAAHVPSATAAPPSTSFAAMPAMPAMYTLHANASAPHAPGEDARAHRPRPSAFMAAGAFGSSAARVRARSLPPREVCLASEARNAARRCRGGGGGRAGGGVGGDSSAGDSDSADSTRPMGGASGVSADSADGRRKAGGRLQRALPLASASADSSADSSAARLGKKIRLESDALPLCYRTWQILPAIFYREREREKRF